MPDQLNKQSLINLLIDSPLREPIKINLIDIVNNTADPDLPKVYSTITKELEIFQKATERRMKLADETIAKLGGSTPDVTSTPTSSMPPMPTPTPALPAMPPVPTETPDDVNTEITDSPVLSVPPLDLPPLPQMPPEEPSLPPTTPVVETPLPTSSEPPVSSTPNLTPFGGAPMTASSDEAALAEIQKELDSLKTSTANEISTAATPAPESTTPVAPVTPVQQ